MQTRPKYSESGRGIISRQKICYFWVSEKVGGAFKHIDSTSGILLANMQK